MPDVPSSGRSEGGTQDDKRPVPDPTTLTTQQILRDVTALRELMESKINSMALVREEEFKAVKLQLDLMERQRIEQKADTQKAVDAALQAQKEAVKEQTIASERAIAKSEAATTKQLEQLGATFKSDLGGVNNTLADVKDRVGRIENIKQGGQQAYAGLYALAAFIAAVVLIGGGVAAFRK